MCSNNHLLKTPKIEVESNLIKLIAIISVSHNTGMFLESIGVCGTICYLGELGASGLAPCKTLKNFCIVSLIPSPFDAFSAGL